MDRSRPILEQSSSADKLTAVACNALLHLAGDREKIPLAGISSSLRQDDSVAKATACT
jgi:hypothetical protein